MKAGAAPRELATDKSPALAGRPGRAQAVVDRRAATAQLVRQQQLADTAPGTQRVRQFQAMAAQKKSIKLEGEDLTDAMKTRFATAYDRFNSTILATSPLASQDNNQVLVYGVSQTGSGMRNYGSTTIYLGNDAYQGDDSQNFTELWSIELADEIDPQTAVRVVIAINLSLNRTIEQLYATLLHEWFVHAVNWEGALDYIRRRNGRFALAWIQGQGYVRRAQGEHTAFAQTSDEEIARRADALGLTGSERDKTVKKMKEDRDEHT